MNFENIEQVIKLIKQNDVKKFKYKDNEYEIDVDFTEAVSQSPAPQVTQAMQQTESTTSTSDSQSSSESTQGEEVKSPMVGTFFLQDEKELTDPIIEVGDEVKKGDVVGYIEAMKVMNEVTSDVEGVVDEILVSHGTNVEYDQAIIRVK